MHLTLALAPYAPNFVALGLLLGLQLHSSSAKVPNAVPQLLKTSALHLKPVRGRVVPASLSSRGGRPAVYAPMEGGVFAQCPPGAGLVRYFCINYPNISTATVTL